MTVSTSTSRPLRWFDTITLTIYHLGLAVLFQTLTPLVLPLLVQQFVGVDRQGSSYGAIRLWSLMAALLVQSAAGTLSDHNTSPWGRRRPYIFTGTVFSLLIIAFIGITSLLRGEFGFWVLFSLTILLNISANSSQGALQGLIPDLVSENQRGFYSGMKALFEVPVPVILVAISTGALITAGKYWLALILIMALLLITMIISMFAPEKPLARLSIRTDWLPIFRLVLMTAFFTLVILLLGRSVKLVSSFVSNMTHSWSSIVMVAVGFLAMTIAVMLGVWVSIKLADGRATRDDTSFSWWVINRLAFLVGVNNLGGFAVYFLQTRFGLEKEQAAGPVSMMIMFVGLSILLITLPGGWLTDRIGPKPLIILSGLIASIGALIIVFSVEIRTIYYGAMAVGVATGLFFSSNWALGTELVPRQEAGRYLGISNLAGAGAGAIGAYIGGPIADHFTRFVPEIPGLGYTNLFIIYILLFLFSTLAITQVRVKRI